METSQEADEDEAPFIVGINWRSSPRLTAEATNALGAALEQVDPEYCIQLPASPGDMYSVTLAGHGTARTAAIEALSWLTTSASALRLSCEVVSVGVFSDEASWDFQVSDLEGVAGPRQTSHRPPGAG